MWKGGGEATQGLQFSIDYYFTEIWVVIQGESNSWVGGSTVLVAIVKVPLDFGRQAQLQSSHSLF